MTFGIKIRHKFMLDNFAPKLSASFCSVLPHQHYCNTSSFWLLDFDTIAPPQEFGSVSCPVDPMDIRGEI